jgi:hypothetical protein
MKITTLVATAAALLASSIALSDEAPPRPNLNPGLWAYTSTMTFDAEMPFPDQTETTQECVTEEDLARGNPFMDLGDECTVTEQDLRADGMDYTMVCSGPDGGEVSMQTSMSFNGDTASGSMRTALELPIGPVQATISIEGERLGDCE